MEVVREGASLRLGVMIMDWGVLETGVLLSGFSIRHSHCSSDRSSVTLTLIQAVGGYLT